MALIEELRKRCNVQYFLLVLSLGTQHIAKLDPKGLVGFQKNVDDMVPKKLVVEHLPALSYGCSDCKLNYIQKDK